MGDEILYDRKELGGAGEIGEEKQHNNKSIKHKGTENGGDGRKVH